MRMDGPHGSLGRKIGANRAIDWPCVEIALADDFSLAETP